MSAIVEGPVVGHPAGPTLIALKRLPNGLEACLIPLTFGRARITLGRQGSAMFDDSW